MRTTKNEVAIEIIDLNKWFGRFHVLRDIDLKVMRGERIVVCGPSGGGKSTLLRCINRIEDWQRGRVIVDGTELTEDLKTIDEVRGEVGMVFQQFNLFPHLTVLENCTLAPIWVRKIPKMEADEIARHYLRRVRSEPDPVYAVSEFLVVGGARLELDARVDVLGVLAEDHHVDLLGVLHRRGHTLEPAHRAQAHVQIQHLPQRHV